ncbi:MAG: ornithine--oxo-acid transaminase [Phycisphaerae bacterium]
MTPTVQAGAKTAEHLELVDRYGARNYAPLPVVVCDGEGVWVHDVDGRKYLDCLSAYSALNFGHRHPRIMQAVAEQCGRLTLTSRAFQNDQLGPFCRELADLCDMDRVLPMNSGAEGVETALKAARKWGYEVKGVPPDQAEILCCTNNFHGRTISIVSFSDDPQFRQGFGPFTPGFPLVSYGDADALERAITPHTVGFLVEPIQGEGGIVVPPAGYLARCLEICRRNNVLLIADEIQTGLARTGRVFCCEHDGVKPDVLILGKALGGGVMPVSAVLASEEVMGVFRPGDHGSTFGGNPLSCAVARAAIATLIDEELADRAAQSGAYFMQKLREMNSPKVQEVRGKGLLIGIVIKPEHGDAHHYCELLAERGMLCKETAAQVVRLAPPLTIQQDEIDWALERLADVLR